MGLRIFKAFLGLILFFNTNIKNDENYIKNLKVELINSGYIFSFEFNKLNLENGELQITFRKNLLYKSYIYDKENVSFVITNSKEALDYISYEYLEIYYIYKNEKLLIDYIEVLGLKDLNFSTDDTTFQITFIKYKNKDVLTNTLKLKYKTNYLPIDVKVIENNFIEIEGIDLKDYPFFDFQFSYNNKNYYLESKWEKGITFIDLPLEHVDFEEDLNKVKLILNYYNFYKYTVTYNLELSGFFYMKNDNFKWEFYYEK